MKRRMGETGIRRPLKTRFARKAEDRKEDKEIGRQGDQEEGYQYIRQPATTNK
jgi:hypothetical protein